MVRRFAWLLAVLIAPSLVHAQVGSEKYLPSGSQLFWQWDGVNAHKDTIAKTAFGQTLAGDTGTFLKAAWTHTRQSLNVAKQHTDPNAIEAAQDALDAATEIYRHGLSVGIGVKNVQAPEVQAVIVLNKSGGEKSKLLSLVNRAKVFAGDLVQEEKVGKRTVYTLESLAKVGWWSEGDDLIIVVGNQSPLDHAQRIDQNKAGLEKHALFAALKKAPEFATWSRGFLDAEALVKMGSDVSPEMATLMEDLGLKGVKSAIGYSGFDGPVCRSVIELDLPGRKGLSNLLASGRKIKLEELPPLPSDVASFSAMSFNPTKAYNSVLDSIGAVTKMYLGQENFARDMIQQIEVLAGIKFGDDLIGSLDDLFVGYSAPSDGVLGLGGVMAMKVKDERKLRSAIQSVGNAIPQIPGAGEVTVKKRKVEGVEITELHMKQEGNFKIPSFAIHKGWVFYSDYPQAIKGFILRLEGKLPAWKLTDDIKKSLEPFPKEFSAIQISDPRPGIQMILSALPPLVAGANGFVDRVEGLKPFDAGLIPHAQEATRLLFPSVSMTTDDGRKIRTETRSSLP